MAAHVYSEVTVMHVGSFDALPAESVALGLTLPTDATLGTTRDTSLSIGWEGTEPDYAGEARMKPAKSFRSHSGINLLGTGVHVVGQVLTAAQSRMYNTSRAWMPSSQAYGAHAATLVWDRALSQDLTSAGYLPGRNVWAANTSIGGQSTANLEGPAGRLAATDGPILSAATAGGARALPLRHGHQRPADDQRGRGSPRRRGRGSDLRCGHCGLADAGGPLARHIAPRRYRMAIRLPLAREG